MCSNSRDVTRITPYLRLPRPGSGGTFSNRLENLDVAGSLLLMKDAPRRPHSPVGAGPRCDPASGAAETTM